jgi:hypothetical protein
LKTVRKGTKKGVYAKKQGKEAPENREKQHEESQRKEEGCTAIRKIVGLWTSRT